MFFESQRESQKGRQTPPVTRITKALTTTRRVVHGTVIAMSSAAHSMYANYNKGKVITTRLGNWTVCLIYVGRVRVVVNLTTVRGSLRARPLPSP